MTIVFDGAARSYRVTGVLRDLPANTHLKLGFLVRLSPEVVPNHADQLTHWSSSEAYTYLRLRSPDDAPAIQAGMPAFIARRVTSDIPDEQRRSLGYRLVPLTALHFHDASTDQAFKPGVDPLFVTALGVMGVMTLLVAIVNYISLATARAGMRAREVAVRKVMGATRGALIAQFVAESVVVTLAAGLIATALAEMALPAVSAVLGEPIRIHYFGADGVAALLAGLCILVGVASGVYPALVLSGFQPAVVLASARTPGGGRLGARVREGLAVFQFAIAIALMVSTVVIFVQIEFLRHADIGFRREGLILVGGLGGPDAAPQSPALVEAFRHIPGVIAATAADRYPATGNENTSNLKRLDNPSINPEVIVERVGLDYGRAYGLSLLGGRFLGPQQRLDDMAILKTLPVDEWQLNGLINESAAHALGFPDARKPVGQTLGYGVTSAGKAMPLNVVGVVRDVRFVSPRRPAAPEIYLQDTRLAHTNRHAEWSAAMRVRESDRAVVTGELQRVWRSIVPSVPFRAETAEAAMNPYYDPDARRGQVLAAGAVLSGMIACLGLYGLAAFNTARRFKEIGIRKALGASTRDVLRLLIGEFLRPVLWANLVAWPIAWFAMRSWLAGFDQRIWLNPLFFLAPAIGAVLIAALTVADQAFRVARAEPALALRYE
jgi:putative ABC transport system permease protein